MTAILVWLVLTAGANGIVYIWRDFREWDRRTEDAGRQLRAEILRAQAARLQPKATPDRRPDLPAPTLIPGGGVPRSG